MSRRMIIKQVLTLLETTISVQVVVVTQTIVKELLVTDLDFLQEG